MDEAKRKRLTEFLYGKKKSKVVDIRMFNCQADMTALYQKLCKTRKWPEFMNYAASLHFDLLEVKEAKGYFFTAWLFCLSGEGYEQACDRVDDFLKEKEKE